MYFGRHKDTYKSVQDRSAMRNFPVTNSTNKQPIDHTSDARPGAGKVFRAGTVFAATEAISILSEWAFNASFTSLPALLLLLSLLVLVLLLLLLLLLLVVLVIFRHIISGLWIGRVPLDLARVLGPSDGPPPSGGRLSSPQVVSSPTPAPAPAPVPSPAGALRVTASPKSARNNRPEGSPRA